MNRFRFLLGLARAAVFWERLWPLLWPSVAVAGLFLGLALLDWLPMLPGWLHGLVIVGFGVAIAAATRFAVKGFAAVGRGQARHRLERDSGLHHRPLVALKDRLAAGNESLWRTASRAHVPVRARSQAPRPRPRPCPARPLWAEGRGPAVRGDRRWPPAAVTRAGAWKGP